MLCKEDTLTDIYRVLVEITKEEDESYRDPTNLQAKIQRFSSVGFKDFLV